MAMQRCHLTPVMYRTSIYLAYACQLGLSQYYLRVRGKFKDDPMQICSLQDARTENQKGKYFLRDISKLKNHACFRIDCSLPGLSCSSLSQKPNKDKNGKKMLKTFLYDNIENINGYRHYTFERKLRMVLFSHQQVITECSKQDI